MKKRGPCKSWNQGERKQAMDAAVEAALAGDDPKAAAARVNPAIIIPRQTLNDRVAAEKKKRMLAANEKKDYAEEEQWDRNKPFNGDNDKKRGTKPLMSGHFCDKLQKIICT